MQGIKISFVIIVYRDIEALSLIIDALKLQTRLPDEIIIAEDGNCIMMREFVDSIHINNVTVKHTTHTDNGWQKNKSLNNALRTTKCDYLIFNDGDCLPYPEVVASHEILSTNNTVLCGRRISPGKLYGERLRNRSLSLAKFKKSLLINYFSHKKHDVKHYEEGFYTNPNGFLFNLIETLSTTRKDTNLLGCCWSAWKINLEKINGFDEDFNMPTVGCDTDIERRLRHFGVQFRSCRNAAITVHLWHKKVFNKTTKQNSKEIMKKKLNIYICRNGLNKL